MAELPLFILYGSATGNAEHIAKDLASTYKSKLPKPFTKIICCEGNDFKKKCLPIWSQETEQKQKYGVVVVISTTGNGDAPENGSRFVRYLKRKTTIEAKPLQHVVYGVLALGDSNYDQFCASGALVDKKFTECGGERVRPVAKADEATGLEEVVEEFIANIIPLLAKACTSGTSGTSTNSSTTSTAEETKMNDIKSGIEEEKKIEQENTELQQHESKAMMEYGKQEKQEISNEAQQEKETTQNVTSSTPSTDLLSNRGVTLVRRLLASLDSSNGMEKDIPEVQPTSLPSIGSSLSSCALVDDKYNERQNSTNAIPLSEMERMTVSSASSSNIHYTLSHPYESTILSASYLTKTPLDGVTKASEALCKSITGGTGSTNNEQDSALSTAMKHIEENFPLVGSPSNSHTENMCYERNGKRVIEMTLSLPEDFTLEYQPGDSIGLVASNLFHTTQYVLSLLQDNHKISRSQLVSMDGQEPITVEDMISNHVDLCSPIKNKKMLVKLSQIATDKEEANALNLLASSDPIGREIFRLLIDEQRLTPVHILQLFPSCQGISINGLVGILPSIPPRYYSICSSPLGGKENTSLSVAFSVVDYITPELNIEGKPRRRVGGLITRYLEAVCSPFIGGCKTPGSFSTPKVKIFPKPSVDFRLPSNMSTPMILIGPGTGIAPFIGFLEHRQVQAKEKEEGNTAATKSISEGTWRGGFEIEEEETPSSKKASAPLSRNSSKVQTNMGNIDVYFGCRYKDHDWLYEEKMKKFEQQGIITDLNIAFSRDNKTKHYVQDKIKQNIERVANMIIHENATIYICGDGNAMAKDVQEAIQQTLQKSESINSAQLSIEKLKDDKRLILDIWS